MHTVFKQACQVSEEPTSESIIQAAYQLSKQERITALEAELYSLCVWKPAPTSAIQTRAQKAKVPAVDEEEEELDQELWNPCELKK